MSWFSMPSTAIYCASKAASWSLTNSLRQELLGQRTHVLALHVGLMDTDMTAGIDAPKSSPDDVAAQALDGIVAAAHRHPRLVDPDALDVVVQLMDGVRAPAGARLFAEGDPGDAAFVVAITGGHVAARPVDWTGRSSGAFAAPLITVMAGATVTVDREVSARALRTRS
jgi:NAD(P)-dependent dehydrogenase (short-subunit alcohol dehydrogenase family)